MDSDKPLETLSSQVIGAYLAKKGQKANALLSVLGRQQPFIDAMSTPAGRELLDDAITVMQEIMQKIVEETATPQEQAEFRALKKIMARWEQKIHSYMTAGRMVKEEVAANGANAHP